MFNTLHESIINNIKLRLFVYYGSFNAMHEKIKLVLKDFTIYRHKKILVYIFGIYVRIPPDPDKIDLPFYIICVLYDGLYDYFFSVNIVFLIQFEIQLFMLLLKLD